MPIKHIFSKAKLQVRRPKFHRNSNLDIRFAQCPWTQIHVHKSNDEPDKSYINPHTRGNFICLWVALDAGPMIPEKTNINS